MQRRAPGLLHKGPSVVHLAGFELASQHSITLGYRESPNGFEQGIEEAQVISWGKDLGSSVAAAFLLVCTVSYVLYVGIHF